MTQSNPNSKNSILSNSINPIVKIKFRLSYNHTTQLNPNKPILVPLKWLREKLEHENPNPLSKKPNPINLTTIQPHIAKFIST